MNSLVFVTGMLMAVSADPSLSGHAPLVGQHLNREFGGDPLLICEYSRSRVKFEILSQNGRCAAYISVQP